MPLLMADNQFRIKLPAIKGACCYRYIQYLIASIAIFTQNNTYYYTNHDLFLSLINNCINPIGCIS